MRDAAQRRGERVRERESKMQRNSIIFLLLLPPRYVAVALALAAGAVAVHGAHPFGLELVITAGLIGARNLCRRSSPLHQSIVVNV